MAENVKEGTEFIETSVNYTLAANVENLTLTGTGDINGTGNALANTINGNAAANAIAEGLGNDLLGGAGEDTFVFNTKLGSTNIDTVDDFSVTTDTIFLDDDIFTKAGAVGDLTSSAFFRS